MTEGVAAYGRGSHYEANEVGALRWVFATLVESAVLAYECALPPLTPQERETYYAESKILGGLFGIPAAALPADWEAFTAYNHAMAASNSLGVSGVVRNMARNILSGAGSWIHPPRWYRALTALWLPNRFRGEFALDFGAADQRAAQRALRRLPKIYPRLPLPIRFVGPWQEARARLDSGGAGALSRLSNRFWIGQPRLPFGDEQARG
ncbi:MAG: oxygenase MpaB family protein [Terracidiphilus sp.]